MRNGRGTPQRKQWGYGLALPALLLAAPFAHAAQPPVPTELNQQSAQNQNAFTNAKGSDDSVDECTNNAMKAFMNLAALNIPGAISKGYQAYGNYLNSEKMDDLEARSKANRGTMSSIMNNLMGGGQGAGAGPAATGASSVSGKVYSQMDTGFLYKGETAETAAEFEKKTGMKREDFFKHMAAGLDSHPTWDDPNLMQKLEGHFNDFKNAVPNKEFRAGLQAAQDSIPNFARNKIMGEIAGFYADATNGWSKATGDQTMLAQNAAAAPQAASESARTLASAAASTTAASSIAGAGGAAPGAGPIAVPAAVLAGAEKIAAAVAAGKSMSSPTRGTDGLFIGIRTGDSAGAIKDFLASPTSLASEQDSLFKTVSKRYRLLTPALLQRAAATLNVK